MAKVKALFSTPEVAKPVRRMPARAGAPEIHAFDGLVDGVTAQQHELRAAVREQASVVAEFRAWIREFGGRIGAARPEVAA